MENAPENLDRQAAGLAVVFTALCAGPFMFMAIAAFIGPLVPAPAHGSQSAFEILRFVMWGYALMTCVMMIVTHSAQTRAMAAASDIEGRFARLRARTIVVTALAESAALLAGIVTLLEGKPLLALPGFLPLCAWIAVGFPSYSRVMAELNAQADSLNRQYR